MGTKVSGNKDTGLQYSSEYRQLFFVTADPAGPVSEFFYSMFRQQNLNPKIDIVYDTVEIVTDYRVKFRLKQVSSQLGASGSIYKYFVTFNLD